MDAVPLATREKSTTTVATEMRTASLDPLDADTATAVARKISSAHWDNFQSTGSIVLRRMVGNNNNDTRSVAVGVACRLLEAPACRHDVATTPTGSDDTTERVVQVLVATRDTTIGEQWDLQAGDVWAQQCDNLHPTASSDGCQEYRFVATTAEDPAADYVDPLFGMRGETPTSVVQWSKGTIF